MLSKVVLGLVVVHLGKQGDSFYFAPCVRKSRTSAAGGFDSGEAVPEEEHNAC